MNKLYAGFSRVNINPKLGTPIAGYYKERLTEGVLDDIEVNGIALECNGTKVIMLSVDLCGLKQTYTTPLRAQISEITGVDANCIYIHVNHTHTGPHTYFTTDTPITREYTDFLTSRIIDAAVYALNDLKPAKLGFGIGQAPNVAFVRRYIMKDGSIKTNPGVNNPDIVGPVGGAMDESVSVLRFDREGADSIVLVSFANHPDVVGGNLISADWPGFARRTVEKVLDNTKCLLFNGIQGDVNHVNVHPKGGDLNDMFMDFDDVSRGYSHARYIGRVVAGGVLQAFDKVEYVDVDSIVGLTKVIKLPANMPTAEELENAKRINALHESGKDSELPYSGMMLTTVVAEAARMVRVADGPDAFEMTLSGIALGPVAFIGIPGEPFSQIGKLIKESNEFTMIISNCLTNGSEGYFPMQDSYDEGGYEARSSQFKAGVAERIAEEAKDLLVTLKANL